MVAASAAAAAPNMRRLSGPDRGFLPLDRLVVSHSLKDLGCCLKVGPSLWYKNRDI